MKYKKDPYKSYKNKDVMISVRVTRREFEWLKTLANEKGISISRMVRLMIEQYWYGV